MGSKRSTCLPRCCPASPQHSVMIVGSLWLHSFQGPARLEQALGPRGDVEPRQQYWPHPVSQSHCRAQPAPPGLTSQGRQSVLFLGTAPVAQKFVVSRYAHLGWGMRQLAAVSGPQSSLPRRTCWPATAKGQLETSGAWLVWHWSQAGSGVLGCSALLEAARWTAGLGETVPVQVGSPQFQHREQSVGTGRWVAGLRPGQALSGRRANSAQLH